MRAVTPSSPRPRGITAIPSRPGVFVVKSALRTMKLLVFAHTPPPHHGQSYMVKLMLDGFGGDCATGGMSNDHGIACYHVNARVSDDMEDVGGIRPGKILRLLRHCIRALYYRFRFGIEAFYYVPAPARKSAIVRDWIVMLLVRPFFRRTVFHWHAFGLGHWATGVAEHPSGPDGPTLEPQCQFSGCRGGCANRLADDRRLAQPPLQERIARWLTRKLLRNADLSIVLTEYNRSDARLLQPKKIAVVPNGIPDPCPDFEQTVLPRRLARLEARRHLLKEFSVLNSQSSMEGAVPSAPPNTPEAKPHASAFCLPPSALGDARVFSVLFLAHCTREKGLFDTLDAVASANSSLRANKSPMRIALTVAGAFMNEEERAEFDARIARSDLQFDHEFIQNSETGASTVRYVGFVDGDDKKDLFCDCDFLCFPSYYSAEALPLTIVESMAFGLSLVTTNWRGLSEILPKNWPLVAQPRTPAALPGIFFSAASNPEFGELRHRFEERFTAQHFARALASAIISLRENRANVHQS